MKNHFFDTAAFPRVRHLWNRLSFLGLSCLLVVACSANDEDDELDDELACVDTMLTGSLPVISQNVDVTGMGIDYLPLPAQEVGSGASELEDITFGWISTIEADVTVGIRASEGVVFDEDTLSRRQHYGMRGCGEDPFGAGVVGGSASARVSEGDLIVVVVKGCTGDCDVFIDFPPPTND